MYKINQIRSVQQWVSAVFIGFLLTGCASVEKMESTRDSTLVSGSIEATEFELATASQPAVLVLSPDDAVRLTVIGYPELTTVTSVQKDGTVSLPVVGELPAAGRSIQEVRQDVSERFAGQLKPGPVRLRIGDTVRLSVWRHADLSGDSTVIADGTLAFPLVGRVPAVDRSLSEVTDDITRKLTEFVRDPRAVLIPQNLNRDKLLQPRVSVTLEKMRNRTVAVLGEVNVPGLMPMQGGSMRVMDVLALAYHRNTADLNSVLVIRKHQANKPAYRLLHLADYMEGTADDQNIYLQPEDIVVVPKTTIAKVGEFIDQFFTHTKPVFDWWIALHQARYAQDTAKLYNSYLEGVLP